MSSFVFLGDKNLNEIFLKWFWASFQDSITPTIIKVLPYALVRFEVYEY